MKNRVGREMQRGGAERGDLVHERYRRFLRRNALTSGMAMEAAVRVELALYIGLLVANGFMRMIVMPEVASGRA